MDENTSSNPAQTGVMAESEGMVEGTSEQGGGRRGGWRERRSNLNLTQFTRAVSVGQDWQQQQQVSVLVAIALVCSVIDQAV